jgi:hypothetical protein
MDRDLDTPEGHCAGLAVVSCCREPDDAGAENLDTLNADVSSHHGLKTSRTAAHFAAVFSRSARVLIVRFDIVQSVSDQLVVIRHRPSFGLNRRDLRSITCRICRWLNRQPDAP